MAQWLLKSYKKVLDYITVQEVNMFIKVSLLVKMYRIYIYICYVIYNGTIAIEIILESIGLYSSISDKHVSKGYSTCSSV